MLLVTLLTKRKIETFGGSNRMSNDIELRVEHLSKFFPVRQGLLATFFSKEKLYVHAVNDISFYVKKKNIFVLAGESGCGKTTTGRLVLRLLEPTAGKIYFRDKEITSLPKEEMRKLRPKMQMIFQDPYESLNPRMHIRDIVSEPLVVNHLVQSKSEIEARVVDALESVGLTPPENFIDRFPHELSGGQRQRVAVARALITEPEFVVADEPVSMLDASIRSSILNLMLELRDKKNLTYLFITHDLAVASYIGDHIAIMYLGKIVEIGDIEKVMTNPQHPYTKALIAAVPEPDPTIKKERIPLKGEPPSPIKLPKGCIFSGRCPFAFERCNNEEPTMIKVEEDHYAACFLLEK